MDIGIGIGMGKVMEILMRCAAGLMEGSRRQDRRSRLRRRTRLEDRKGKTEVLGGEVGRKLAYCLESGCFEVEMQSCS